MKFEMDQRSPFSTERLNNEPVAKANNVVYHIADKPMTMDEWEQKWCSAGENVSTRKAEGEFGVFGGSRGSKAEELMLANDVRFLPDSGPNRRYVGACA